MLRWMKTRRVIKGGVDQGDHRIVPRRKWMWPPFWRWPARAQLSFTTPAELPSKCASFYLSADARFPVARRNKLVDFQFPCKQGRTARIYSRLCLEWRASKGAPKTNAVSGMRKFLSSCVAQGESSVKMEGGVNAVRISMRRDGSACAIRGPHQTKYSTWRFHFTLGFFKSGTNRPRCFFGCTAG